MKATFKENHISKFNRKHRKENGIFLEEYVALIPKEVSGRKYLHAVVTVRTYGTTTNGSNSACVWIHGDNYHKSGSGHASGYGYHRTSQAVGYALENAGVVLSEDIGGRGEGAIESAIMAVAEALGFPEAMIHRAHP